MSVLFSERVGIVIMAPYGVSPRVRVQKNGSQQERQASFVGVAFWWLVTVSSLMLLGESRFFQRCPAGRVFIIFKLAGRGRHVRVVLMDAAHAIVVPTGDPRRSRPAFSVDSFLHRVSGTRHEL